MTRFLRYIVVILLLVSVTVNVYLLWQLEIERVEHQSTKAVLFNQFNVALGRASSALSESEHISRTGPEHDAFTNFSAWFWVLQSAHPEVPSLRQLENQILMWGQRFWSVDVAMQEKQNIAATMVTLHAALTEAMTRPDGGLYVLTEENFINAYVNAFRPKLD